MALSGCCGVATASTPGAVFVAEVGRVFAADVSLLGGPCASWLRRAGAVFLFAEEPRFVPFDGCHAAFLLRRPGLLFFAVEDLFGYGGRFLAVEVFFAAVAGGTLFLLPRP